MTRRLTTLDAIRFERIRQAVNCPTCDGKQLHCNQCDPSHDMPCPDCTDGKIPMARLLAVGVAVFSAEYMNRNQAGEWRPVIVNALPSGSPRAAVFAEQLLDYLLQVKTVSLTPRERWGTCCPHDPECDHSLLDDDALVRWMETPITDAQAVEVVFPRTPTSTSNSTAATS